MAAEDLLTLSVTRVGGVNYADDPGMLAARALGADASGAPAQIAPLEFPDALDIDFFPSGFGKRHGSTYLESLTTQMAAVETAAGVSAGTEELIRGKSFKQVGGSRTRVIVGKYGIYIDTGSGWNAATYSGGGTYYHGKSAATATAATKASMVELDGRLFIATDANTYIQVLRSATTLDQEMKEGNTYNDSYGGGTHVMTGSAGQWDKACYIVFAMQGRLCYSNGSSVVQATTSNPYDRLNGTFIQFRGPVIAAGTFVRRQENVFNETMYALTPVGVEFQAGFTASDAPMWLSGSGECINYRMACVTRNWLMYMTTARTIEMANLTRFDDIGRRLKSQDNSRGTLATISLSNTATYGFSFYNALKKQAQFYVVDTGSTRPSHTAVVDLQLGEPGANEGLPDFERHVRMLMWGLNQPATNENFVDVFDTIAGPVGIKRTGLLYTMESGANDQGSIAIKDYFFLPEFDAGVPTRGKNFRKLAMRSEPRGNWLLYGETYLNRDSAPSGNLMSFNQLTPGSAVYDTAVYDVDSYVEGGLVPNAAWVELWATSSARFKFYNGEADHDYVIAAIDIQYQIGEEST